VTSFSKAAAAELAGKDLPLPPDRIGTLHSHCFRALGSPKIAEAEIGPWNEENEHLRITPARKGRVDGDEEEDHAAGNDGDAFLEQLSRFRGMMVPRELWSSDLKAFERKWTDYKNQTGTMDFTDLIERAAEDTIYAPGAPSVVFCDEAQDLNRLQASLIRKWGERCAWFLLAGDDDQLIYQWAGATPDVLLKPELPAENIRVLSQSWRIPGAVHELAQRWIEQVSERQPKDYKSRPERGAVDQIEVGNFLAPRALVDHAIDHIADGRSVMFLGACSYHLHPLVKVLRDEAIPFSNKYRRSNGAWNPIRTGSHGGAVNRIMSLLAQHPDLGEDARAWKLDDVALFAGWLSSKGILKRGAKKIMEAWTPELDARIEDLVEIFEEKALESLFAAAEGDVDGLLDWWTSRLSDTFAKRADFPARIVKRCGTAGLFEEAPVTVGTIHSVKGGEADVVYLFPDLSRAGWAGSGHTSQRDAIVRQFYVGITRAKQQLYLCPAASDLSVSIR
jgi:DNA helicase II / ATP-dependent DNA helicase PcrA